MLPESIMETLMITSVVMVIMLLIEYFNVHSQRSWSAGLKDSWWKQIGFSALIGITPGCLGIYTVVSLYTHRIIGFAGLLTATIATIGDEAFVMFSIIPKTGILILSILFPLALILGFLFSLIIKNPSFALDGEVHEIHRHDHQEGKAFDWNTTLTQLKNCSFPRAILLFGLAVFIFGLVSGFLVHQEGIHGHTGLPEWDFLRISSLAGALVALFIVLSVPDHFLEHHLWEHIIKKHFLRIFLWTFAALVVIGGLINFLQLDTWLKSNPFTVLIIAMLVGIIPISGPHIIFITLFASGAIPFSILLCNSIVQDGHGALPLFAESKKSFFLVKLVKLMLAFIVGILGLWAGF
jgi:hypothetical protein